MVGRDTFQQQMSGVAVATAVLILLASSHAVEASRMLNICANTAYPSLCEPLVKHMTDPRRATHKTIQALEDKTKQALADTEKNKNGDQVLAMCHAKLSDAVYNLMGARKSIRKRNVRAMTTFLSAVVSDYGTCVDGFIEAGQVNTVQNLVSDLRRISTNCLELSTLIN